MYLQTGLNKLTFVNDECFNVNMHGAFDNF